MKIFVMRHGDAELVAASDMQRPLSSQGKNEVVLATEWLQEHYFSARTNFDLAFVSPFLRTKQTFAKITDKFTVSRTEFTRDIIPTASAATAHDYLDTVLSIHQGIQSVLVVSHMPFVSYFTESLTGQNPLFATASIAVIDYDKDANKGQLITHQQAYFS